MHAHLALTVLSSEIELTVGVCLELTETFSQHHWRDMGMGKCKVIWEFPNFINGYRIHGYCDRESL